MSHAADVKYLRLQELLHALGRVVVAYSGGVDSTFLLRVAQETLGNEQVLAIIGQLHSMPSREIASAVELASAMNAPYRVMVCDELSEPLIAANPSTRCYHCKRFFLSRLLSAVEEGGYASLLDGSNADDTGDYRPGLQAVRELGVRSPLLEVGLTKAEIRELSHRLGLPTWDKPSAACLASRIPYGSPITRKALSAIEQAENVLHDLGFAQVRVRHHDALARIEIAPEQIARMADAHLRATITDRLRAIGYQYVALDLLGYRTGSMNETLSEVDKVAMPA